MAGVAWRIWGLLGFIVGIGLAVPFDINWLWFSLPVISLLILWLPRKQPAVFLLGIVAGLGYIGWFNHRLTAPVTFDQSKLYQFVLLKPSWESTNNSAVVKLDGINRSVLLKYWPELTAGTVWECNGTVAPIKNFNDFDYHNYLLSKNVVGELRCSGDIASKQARSGPSFWLENYRKYLLNSIGENFSGTELALAQGLLIGYRATFSDTFVAAMKNTGTTHIVAISGYNIAIVIVLLFNSCLRFGLKKAFLISSVGIVVFTMLTGAESSVVRAALLGLLVIGAKTMGRPQSSLYWLGLTATVMLILNPLLLRYNLGFQLSFGAFAGILFVTPQISQLKLLQSWPNFLRDLVATTLGAQIAVAPLLLVTTGSVSPLSLISNVLILPIIPLAMLLVAITLGLTWVSLGFVTASAAQLVLQYILWVINYGGEHFHTVPLVIKWPTALLAEAAIFGLVIVRSWRDNQNKRLG